MTLSIVTIGQPLVTSTVQAGQDNADTIAITQDNADTIVISQVQVGPQGPQGPPGGGSGGGGGDLNYTHAQSAAAVVWTITHGLNKYPSVTVIDSAGTQWEGYVTYLTVNSLSVEFSVPFGGTAYLN